MYAAVVVCVLVAAVSAGKVPPRMPGVPPLMKPGPGPKPEKCCADPYYTYEADSIAMSVKDGGLFTEFVHGRGAYDSIGKKIGKEFVLDFSNGTEDVLKLIADFQSGEGYIIYNEAGEKVCVNFPITAPFPYNCLPERSTFIGSVSLGDRALQVNNWYASYASDPAKEEHVVFSIQQSDNECVDSSSIGRTFDALTGAELETVTTSFSDFNLGICDPDRWFKPPAECEGVKLMKAVPKKALDFRGPNGRRLIFE